MSREKLSYLRTHRMRSGLSLGEVAFLLGLSNCKAISRSERTGSGMALEQILALQIIFNVSAHELYPGMHLKVEQLALTRIQTLIRKLEGEVESKTNRYKRQTLVEIETRIGCA